MSITSLNDFCSNLRRDNLVPIFKELPADLETPASAFLKLGKNPPSFLLESVERGEQLGRYSFIGTNPYLTVETSGNKATIKQNGEHNFLLIILQPGHRYIMGNLVVFVMI